MSGDLALDFGTASTRIADRHGTLLFEEPTLAAIDRDSGRLVRFGQAALGSPAFSVGRVGLVHPVREGQLADLRVAEAVLADALRRVGASRIGHPRVLVSVRAGATKVQRRALERALRGSGVRQVRFIEHPIACAVGSHLDFGDPTGSMVVDVGAGTSDVGVLALGGLVTAASIPCGGDDLVEGVRQHLARRHGVVVDHPVAADVLRRIGSLDVRAPDAHVEVFGREVASGRVARTVVARSELRPVFETLLAPVFAAAVECITTAPPDVANDLLGAGLVLAGEGCQLNGFDQRLASVTGVPVHIAPEGGRCAVLGASRCLSMLERMNASAISSSARR